MKIFNQFMMILFFSANSLALSAADIAPPQKVAEPVVTTVPKPVTAEISNSENLPVFANESNIKPAQAPSDRAPWVKTALSIIVVLGLFAGSLVFFKRYRGMDRRPNRKRMIEVQSQHFFSPRKSVAVLRVAGESVLVGITDSQISFLKSLSLLDEDVPQPKSFEKALGQSVVNESKKVTTVTAATPADDADAMTMSDLKEFVASKLKNYKEI